MKCGNCQRNTIRNNVAAARSNCPPTAVQPISTGIAPATAPDGRVVRRCAILSGV